MRKNKNLNRSKENSRSGCVYIYLGNKIKTTLSGIGRLHVALSRARNFPPSSQDLYFIPVITVISILQPAGEKKQIKRASQTGEKTKSTFSFSEIFFLLFREKKCGTRSKHAKKAKNAKKAKIVEATKKSWETR